MCSAIKYPYLPLKGLEFPGGGVFFKITTFEEIYEAWLENFQRGVRSFWRYTLNVKKHKAEN